MTMEAATAAVLAVSAGFLCLVQPIFCSLCVQRLSADQGFVLPVRTVSVAKHLVHALTVKNKKGTACIFVVNVTPDYAFHFFTFVFMISNSND